MVRNSTYNKRRDKDIEWSIEELEYRYKSRSRRTTVKIRKYRWYLAYKRASDRAYIDEHERINDSLLEEPVPKESREWESSNRSRTRNPNGRERSVRRPPNPSPDVRYNPASPTKLVSRPELLWRPRESNTDEDVSDDRKDRRNYKSDLLAYTYVHVRKIDEKSNIAVDRASLAVDERRMVRLRIMALVWNTSREVREKNHEESVERKISEELEYTKNRDAWRKSVVDYSDDTDNPAKKDISPMVDPTVDRIVDERVEESLRRASRILYREERRIGPELAKPA